MALSVILGPRLGKYRPDGKVKVFPARNLVYVVTGTFILLFGWMGFNPGSTLGASDHRISVIAVNTNLAAVAGSAAAMFLWYLLFGKPNITMACNGMLAGLVAITAPCAFVSPNSAVVIGIVAGVVVCLGVLFNDRVVKIDDPCGAISVHGTCGAWGVISLGLFADGTYGDGLNSVAGTVRGLFYGDPSQLLAEIIGAVTNVIFVFVASMIFFKIIDLFIGNRVSVEVELEGLDVPEMGVPGYAEMQGPSTSGMHR